MKKLVIDFRMCNASGIGTYIKSIVPYLVDVFEVILIGNSSEIQKFKWSERVKIIEANSKIYSIYEQIELFMCIPNCDVFWSPHYNIPLLPIKAKKRVVTIHDVFHLAFFETLNFKQKLYSKFVIKQAVKKSSKIFTVSSFSVNEIKKYTNTNKDIQIIYNAIDFTKFTIINDRIRLKNIKEKYQLPNEFLLFVGNVKPHKNIKNLLYAIKDINVNLVIVGKKDGFITGDDEVINLIKSGNMEDRVFFTGYVEDEDIPDIYNLATVFVFPSLYEGFGIPPLEAQACGCPVVCSNVASLPEVAGDSVIYCNPYDSNDIKEKIELLLNDKNLQNQLITKGYENIKRFSWKESAEKIIEVVERLDNK